MESTLSALTIPVLISTSKRAVNSLLLSDILEQLKGWMDLTFRVRSILVLHLFYRLSFGVSYGAKRRGNINQMVFQQDIDLNRPFADRTQSSIGEVAILVFMFSTLMLKNWHQHGSDDSILRHSGITDVHDKNVIQVSSSTSKTSVDDQEKNEFVSQCHILNLSGSF